MATAAVMASVASFFVFIGFREIRFFCIREPADLVGTVFDAEEEQDGEQQGRNGLDDEELLPAVHAEERRLQQHARKRCADDVRKQERAEHQARGACALAAREPAREQHGVDDRIEARLRRTQ